MWTFVTFADSMKPGGIRPHWLHRNVRARRLSDINRRYEATPIEMTPKENLHFDLGGMVHIEVKPFEIRLGPKRTISCWKHQAHAVLEKLKRGQSAGEVIPGFVRFKVWPGSIAYISERDRARFIKALEKELK